jgi:hypothetical protein
MFKISTDIEKRGEMVDEKMGVVERHNIHIENEKGHILFTWTVKTVEERDVAIAEFNKIKNNVEAIKSFVAEIKAKRGW